MTNSEFKFNLFKAALNKSVRVEPVETHSLQINNLQMASTGSARTEGLVQHCLKERRLYQPAVLDRSKQTNSWVETNFVAFQLNGQRRDET
jgi:hypothetical protein